MTRWLLKWTRSGSGAHHDTGFRRSDDAAADAPVNLFDHYVSLLPPARWKRPSARTCSARSRSWPKHCGAALPCDDSDLRQSITAALRAGAWRRRSKRSFRMPRSIPEPSISGFSAGQLVRSILNDVYPLDPDLVILHDMG